MNTPKKRPVSHPGAPHSIIYYSTKTIFAFKDRLAYATC